MPNKINFLRESGRVNVSYKSAKSEATRISAVELHQIEAQHDLAIAACKATSCEQLLESKIIGIFVIDLAGSVVDANDTFLTMTGHEREDLPFRWNVTTPPNYSYLAQEKIAEAVDTPATIRWEKDYVHRDGADILVLTSPTDKMQERRICLAVEVSSTQFKDGSIFSVRESAQAMPGDAEGLLLVGEDVSDRKQTANQFAQYETKLKSLTIDIILAEEGERRRIAQGLHDQVGHALALAKIKSFALKASEQSPDRQQIIVDICDYLDEAIDATRALTFDLSSPVLHEVGLEAALETLGEKLDEQTNLRFHFECDSIKEPLAKEIAVIIYRTVEELVLNVFKHAEAHNIYICVQPIGEGIQVSVDDDGVGLPPSEDEGLPEPHGKFGLFSIRTRIEQLGGRFDIGASPQGGTRAVIAVPTVSHEIGIRFSSTHSGKDASPSTYERYRQREIQ